MQAQVSQALLSISDFVHVSGDFAFRRGGTSLITVKDGSKITSDVKVNSIDIGANNVHAFVGINGPTTDVNGSGVVDTYDLSDNAVGLKISDFDFGLSILTTEFDSAKPLIPKGTQFTALKAHAEGIGFVGFGDFIQFDLKDVSVAINQGQNGMVADFTQGATVAGRTVQTGGTAILLDFNSEWIEASVGLATASVAGIVSLQGGFAFQKRTLDRIGFNLAGIEVVAPADALVVAGVGVQAFAGYNGPYRTVTADANGQLVAGSPKTDAVGFAIDNLDFVLSMVAPSKASGFAVPGVNFYSLKASADKAGLVGTDPYLTLEGTDVIIRLNGAVANGYPIPTLFVDYTELPGHALTIDVGTHGKKMTLDYDSNLLGLQIKAKLGIFDLFDISHDFDFDFEMPSIDLGSLGLPSIPMPSLDSLLFGFPTLKLPTLPDVDWAALLSLPDLDLNLPRLTLPAWSKLVLEWPELQLQFPDISFPELPAFPSLDIFNIGDIDWSLPRIDLSALGNLVLNWPDLKVQFPHIVFPSLDLPDFSLDLPGFHLPTGFMPTISLSGLKDLIPELPDVGFFKGALNFISNLDLSIGFDLNLGAIVLGKISLPDLNLSLGDFVHLSGDFELNLGQTFNGTMYTGLPADLSQMESLLGSTGALVVDAIKLLGGISADYSRVSNVDFKGLTLGGSDIYAYIGAGIPDFSRPLSEQSGLTGFGLENLDIGLGIFKADLPDFFKAQNFYSLTAHADQVGTYGFGDVLKLTAQDITLEVNAGGELFGGFMRSRADFKTSFAEVAGNADPEKNKPAGYKVSTGGAPVYLDFSGEDIMGLDIGMADIQVSEFLSLRGSLAFRKGERFNVNVNPGGLSTLLADLGSGPTIPMQVEAMTLGGANLSGFAGVGGPYRYGVDVTGGPGRRP